MNTKEHVMRTSRAQKRIDQLQDIAGELALLELQRLVTRTIDWHHALRSFHRENGEMHFVVLPKQWSNAERWAYQGNYTLDEDMFAMAQDVQQVWTFIERNKGVLDRNEEPWDWYAPSRRSGDE